MSGAAADVRFDFDGSLRLARRLWVFSAQIDTMMGERVRLAGGALDTWLGRYGEEFAGRIETESVDSTRIAGELRSAAQAWGVCWASAMNEQNRILYAREVKRVEDRRSNWDSFWGGFTGHDDLPPMPNEMAPPTAPWFAATGSFVRY